MESMTKVEEIERAIEGLTPEEWVALSEWIEEYKADAWDRQIDEDAKAGRLDFLVDQALAHEAAGRVRDL